MRKLFNRRLPITLLFVLIISSCSNDNSIVGNSDSALYKPNTYESIHSGTDDHNSNPDSWSNCMAIYFTFTPPIFWSVQSDDTDAKNIDISYNFRDNYLDSSPKGVAYKSMYYRISEFSIKNNLINQYYKEHKELFTESVEIARELQYGRNTSNILVSEDISNSLKKMLSIYRAHPNHREIDDALDYLEKDLVKYENQPQSVIAKDFK